MGVRPCRAGITSVPPTCSAGRCIVPRCVRISRISSAWPSRGRCWKIANRHGRIRLPRVRCRGRSLRRNNAPRSRRRQKPEFHPETRQDNRPAPRSEARPESHFQPRPTPQQEPQRPGPLPDSRRRYYHEHEEDPNDFGKLENGAPPRRIARPSPEYRQPEAPREAPAVRGVLPQNPKAHAKPIDFNRRHQRGPFSAYLFGAFVGFFFFALTAGVVFLYFQYPQLIGKSAKPGGEHRRVERRLRAGGHLRG